MPQPLTLTLTFNLSTTLYELQEHSAAENSAWNTRGRVYTFKTTANQNWLAAGYSIVDALGLVVLPNGLPDTLSLPDDEEDSSQTP